MSSTFTYPQNYDIREIGAIKVARMAAARLGFKILPMKNHDAAVVEWTQKDNYFGLQQLRGYDGAPQHVANVGMNRFSYNPGVYGEYGVLDELELTKRAKYANPTAGIPADITDLVMGWQKYLIQRELDRMESIIWTLLTTGTFSVSSPGGQIVFTDTFTLQTASAIVSWGTYATAVPLQDFRALQLLGAGLGVNLGNSARAYMNAYTKNRLLNNSNSADLGGKRKNVGSTINSLPDVNSILVDNDVPQVEVYNEAYYNDSNVLTYYIPNNIVVVVGSRVDGEPVGEYALTRNANNPGYAPGSYDYVEDHSGNAPDGSRYIPANIKVHRGNNGGPLLWFPSAIVVLTVT